MGCQTSPEIGAILFIHASPVTKFVNKKKEVWMYFNYKNIKADTNFQMMVRGVILIIVLLCWLQNVFLTFQNFSHSNCNNSKCLIHFSSVYICMVQSSVFEVYLGVNDHFINKIPILKCIGWVSWVAPQNYKYHNKMDTHRVLFAP